MLEILPNSPPSDIGPLNSDPTIVTLQANVPSDVEKVSLPVEGIVIAPAGLIVNDAWAAGAAASRASVQTAVSVSRFIMVPLNEFDVT